MITFLTIFLVLIGFNAIIMLVSLKQANKKAQKLSPKTSKREGSVIYPINLLSHELKKAV